MRRYLLLAITLVFCTALKAQTFGIKGGVNFANLTGNDSDGFKGQTGFHIGALVEFGLVGRLSIQPELLYSVQGAEIGGENYKLNYATLPVMLKFDIDGSLSVHAGPQFALLASETAGIMPKEANNYDFAIAAGLEYAITDGLFVQARYVRGQTQVFEDADIKNSVIQMSLGFYF